MGGGAVAVATPDDTLWQRDPHTEAKHLVLAGYWRAWFPIMLQLDWTRRLTVFEGYAGPGEYLGEPDDPRPLGSPIVAMRTLLERPELVSLGKQVKFVFLEDRSDRVDNLRRLITDLFPDLPQHLTWQVEQGRCENDALPLLESTNSWGHPIFANLDPFDAYVPLPVVERLAKNSASEAFITFMSDRLRRFASLERLTQGDTMFGDTGWRDVQHQVSPEGKEAWLVERYRSTLRSAGLGRIAGFKLVDDGGHAFWLLYATRNQRGLQVMKDAMWKVDPIRGFRFRDPRDPRQGMLDLSMSWQPDLGPLRAEILDYLLRAGRVTVEEVRLFALEETSYKEVHAVTALRDLIDDKYVGRDPEKGQLHKAVEVWPIGHPLEQPLFQ